MNLPGALAVSVQLLDARGFREALRAACRRASWRVVGMTFAISAALDVWLFFDLAGERGLKLPTAEGYLSGAIINLLMAFCIMATTLVADERVARGAKRFTTYGWAVVIGSAVAALAQWEVHEWLHLRTRDDVPGIPHEVTIMQPAVMFFEYLIWGSIIVFIYVNRRTALLAAARTNAAQVKRAQVQRRTLESRLQALQARVEPQFLFNTLAQVSELYQRDPAKGGQMLSDLIIYLRAALPHLRDSTSTLKEELELVSAYLSIVRAHLGERLAFDIGVPEVALGARMPPLILLPLIDHVLAHRLSPSVIGGTIYIAARVTGDALHLEISEDTKLPVAESFSGPLGDIRDRLHALYGGRGTLDVELPGTVGTRVVIEIPYEATDGNHR